MKALFRIYRMIVDGKAVATTMSLLAAAASPAANAATVVCTRPSHIYSCGERAEFEVSSRQPGEKVGVTFTRGYLHPPLASFETTTPARVSFALNEPGFIVCRVGAGKEKPAVAGAGFEPANIRTALPPPEDYDAFWKRAFAEQKAIAPDFETTPLSNGVEMISCRTVWGTRMYGFLRVPKGSEPSPLQITVGGGSSEFTAYDVVPMGAQKEYADRAFLFLHLPGWDPNVKTPEEKAVRKKKWVEDNRIAGGTILNWNRDKGPRERWYYRCILGCCRLIEYAARRPGIDPERVHYVGASTGGGYGVFLAAFSPYIRAAVCEVPNYGNAGGPAVGRPSGEDDRGKWWKTSLYFDSAYCAPRITCPVFMSCGFTDDYCTPETVYCIYNALRCRKVMYEKVENGHGDCPKGYSAVRDAWLGTTFGMRGPKGTMDVSAVTAAFPENPTSGQLTGLPRAAHPLITVRLNASSRPDDYRKIVEINRKYRGSVDEYWFGRGGAGPRLEILSNHWRTQSPMKAVCENAGIACGFQQGVTLGHGSIYSSAGGGQAKVNLHPFTDDAWQIGKDGNQVLMFCPRSAEVLKYEEEYAATLGKILHPVSLWLDDDLRLGFCKPDGCFCTNCLAAFGKKWGQPVSRQELVMRLSGGAEKDPIRRAWLDFQSESLAIYGAAARRGTNRTNPECLVAYQSVDPMTLETGRDYRPLLNALSDNGKHPTSIRIGSGCYSENLNELTAKMFGVIFEVERVKRSSLNLSAISYEQESYRREAIHKTPEAIAVESALAFACGCDAVTEYYWDENRAEPIWYYEEFARTMSVWRPYFERLAAIARKTSLGGVARFIGSDFDLIAKKTLRSGTDADLYGFGVPVTVAASGTRIFYVNSDTMLEWGEGDVDRLFMNDAVALVDAPSAQKFFAKAGEKARAAEKAGKLRVFDFAASAPSRHPTHAERAQLLDAFDSLNGAKLPVRVERSHPLYVYPRVDADGCVVAVTFYNGAAGAMLPTRVRIRRPVSSRAVWARAEASDLQLSGEANDGELTLTIPKIPARQVATLIF